MSRVVDIGPASNLALHARVVLPFTISCGRCFFCQGHRFSACENSNPVENQEASEKLFRKPVNGYFGYSGYVRVPFSDVGPVELPDSVSDDEALFLSDILPTGWMAAETAQIQAGDVVAAWGHRRSISTKPTCWERSAI